MCSSTAACLATMPCQFIETVIMRINSITLQCLWTYRDGRHSDSCDFMDWSRAMRGLRQRSAAQPPPLPCRPLDIFGMLIMQVIVSTHGGGQQRAGVLRGDGAGDSGSIRLLDELVLHWSSNSTRSRQV